MSFRPAKNILLKIRQFLCVVFRAEEWKKLKARNIKTGFAKFPIWTVKVGNQARRLTIDIVKLESLLYKSKGEVSSHGKFFSFTCFAFWCWQPPLTVPTSYRCGTTKSDLVIGCWAAVYSSCTVIVKYRCCRGTAWFFSTSETVWARFATHVLAELIFTCTILLSAVSIRRRAVIVQWTVCKMKRNTDNELNQ